MAAPRHPVINELLIALAIILSSLTFLPGIIFAIGAKLFGAYQGGMRQMYLDTLGDLIKPTWSAWILALVPALCVLALRLIFRRPDNAGTQDDAPGEKPTRPARQEPTVS